MTAANLELDQAAAAAMGWTQSDQWPEFTPDQRWVPPGFKIPSGLPGFSVDAEHLPEMLEWLRASLRSMCFTSYAVAQWGWAIEAVATDGSKLPIVIGSTISEAVARLVVEVAQRQGKTR